MKSAIALLLFSQTLFGIAQITVPFSLPQMNSEGKSYKSSDHPGAVYVIEAYFNGCSYCNENAPQVNALAAKYASDPLVQVLDIGVDRMDFQYEAWIANNEPNHPVLKDPKRTVIGQLGTKGFPSTYVVDCHGTVVAETKGVWTSEEISQIDQAIPLALEACLR